MVGSISAQRPAFTPEPPCLHQHAPTVAREGLLAEKKKKNFTTPRREREEAAMPALPPRGILVFLNRSSPAPCLYCALACWATRCAFPKKTGAAAEPASHSWRCPAHGGRSAAASERTCSGSRAPRFRSWLGRGLFLS